MVSKNLCVCVVPSKKNTTVMGGWYFAPDIWCFFPPDMMFEQTNGQFCGGALHGFALFMFG
jgi:hypothetical protein